MSLQAKTRISPEEYLAMEREAETKHEYFDGEVFAMVGASPKHVLIVTNIVSSLHAQFRGRPCTVYASDLRLKVSPTGLYTYPDIVALCDKPEFDDDQEDTLTNPALIVEVLSKSTMDYDRGRKFEHYRSLRSFQEYLLVAQDKHHVEHFIRQSENRWLFSETKQLEDIIELPSIECTLSLTDIYEKVDI